MKDTKSELDIVSKPPGIVDDCCLISWLEKNRPDLLEDPIKIERLTSNFEAEEGYYLISPYKTPNSHDRFFKIKIKWEFESGSIDFVVWSSLYTNVKVPENAENIKNLTMAKAEVLMLAKAYCDQIHSLLDPNEYYSEGNKEKRRIFLKMKYFNVETTPTGRVKNFFVATNKKNYPIVQEGHFLHTLRLLSPYFNLAEVDLYETKTRLKNLQDPLFIALMIEKDGHLNRTIIDYYTLCGKRYLQTFEEAYTRFIDVVANDKIQSSLRWLREMEAKKEGSQPPIQILNEKFKRVQKHLERHHQTVRNEYLVMQDCYRHLQILMDKFDAWKEHPELSLAQTSLLEGKIEEMAEILSEKRLLMSELRSRYEGIEYWPEWFSKQFPNLYRLLKNE